MIGTELAPLTGAVLKLLGRTTARLAQLMGTEPEMGDVREGLAADAEVPRGALVVFGEGAGTTAIRIAVLPPPGGSADQVANVPSVIAEHLESVLPQEGIAAAVVDVLPEGTAEPSDAVSIEYSAGGKAVGTVVVWTSGGLIDLMDSPPGRPEPPVGDAEATVATELEGAALLAGEVTSPSPAMTPPLAAFGNLSQVELDVTVELGSADLTIRELLDLSPGSVVRMGTQIGQPFRILVNGRPAATGDLVVVNGRLGVRIREIIPG